MAVGGKKGGPMADINVTPMADIMIVLLIIFMVITPQMEAGAPVDLPAFGSPDPKTQAKLEPITVSLTSRGALYLEKRSVSRSALRGQLRALREADPRRRVVVRADKEVRYGAVRALFRECQELGFPGVSMQVGEPRRDRDKES
jgi:biopolymer transport protein ExbD